jgi:hypothetical protein
MEQRHYWLHIIDGIDEEWMLFLSKAENSPSTGTLRKTDRKFPKNRNEWKFKIMGYGTAITCMISCETKRAAMSKCVKILKALNKIE